jgi:hypothetical protein
LRSLGNSPSPSAATVANVKILRRFMTILLGGLNIMRCALLRARETAKQRRRGHVDKPRDEASAASPISVHNE